MYVDPRTRTFESEYEKSDSAVEYFLAKESYDTHHRGPYHRIAAELARLQPGASVLDVGAGTGTFLTILEKHGLNGTGVELSRACVQYGTESKGRRLFQGTIERVVGIAPRSFDVATMIQTLEHVGEPVATLGGIKRFLKPRGLLYVDVPNYNFLLSRVERILRTNVTHHWDPTAHLYYFTRRTLGLVAKAAGFRLLEMTTPAPSILHKLPSPTFGKIADELFSRTGTGRIVRMLASA